MRDRNRNPWERRYDRDADMGGSEWSGASGRGGMSGQMGGSDLGFGYAEHEGYEERGPHYGKGPKGYRRSDERIHEDVCETIARQGYIDASDVEVKVEKGIVTLSGTVGLRQEKRALEQMVERVRGVEDVQNELRLQRHEPPTSQRTPQHNGPNGRTART